MARRRMRLRKPHGSGEHLAAAVVAVAVAVATAKTLNAAWHALPHIWPLVVTLAAAGPLYGLLRHLRVARARATRAAALQRLRITLLDVDTMNDEQFEHALRDLLIRDGWTARHVGRKGDQAADVIGEDRQRGRIVLQAKHTKVGGKVGSSIMYQVKGTAGPVHRADHAVVVTNGFLTRDAQAWGDRHGIHWVDRDGLRAWAEQGAALHELLGLPSRPSLRTPSRRAA